MASALTRPELKFNGGGADATGRASEPLDTTVSLATPERIVFEYPLAGPFRRFMAYLIDIGVIAALLLAIVVAFMAMTWGSLSGAGPILVGYFVLVWGYGAACEGCFSGRTVGKYFIGLRVVTDQGLPVTGAQAVLRNLVGAVDGPFPFAYILGLSCMVATRKFQRLGDLAAGTMVVVEARQRRSGVIQVKEPEVEKLLPWLPVRVAAGTDMARALSDYARTRSRYNPRLREEIAGALAGPLRVRHGLPADATSDAVLCAVYHRVFLGE